MDALVETLVSLLGPHGPLLAAGAAGLLLITFTLPFILIKKKDPFDRIKSPTQQPVTKQKQALLRFVE